MIDRYQPSGAAGGTGPGPSASPSEASAAGTSVASLDLPIHSVFRRCCHRVATMDCPVSLVCAGPALLALPRSVPVQLSGWRSCQSVSAQDLAYAFESLPPTNHQGQERDIEVGPFEVPRGLHCQRWRPVQPPRSTVAQTLVVTLQPGDEFVVTGVVDATWHGMPPLRLTLVPDRVCQQLSPHGPKRSKSPAPCVDQSKLGRNLGAQNQRLGARHLHP